MSVVSIIVKRPEDSVQESLADFVEKVWPVLGRFFNDEETKVSPFRFLSWVLSCIFPYFKGINQGIFA